LNNNLINNILEKITISDIIGTYITLEKKGNNFFGVCPFHDDTRPSMSVSNEKNIYKCFSCGAGGNVINFVKEYKKISFADALRELSITADLEADFTSYYKDFERDKIQYKEIEVINKMSDFYEMTLNSEQGTIAFDYLQKRSLTIDDLKRFRIGFSPANNNLFDFLKTTNPDFTEIHIRNTNLFNTRNNDKMSNRIIFPIFNTYDQCIGFSGRILNDGTPKYLNSSESVFFQKSKILYNLGSAINHLNFNFDSNTLIVTEGFFDVIRLSKQNFGNVVATMGTAFTDDHIKLLRKYKIEEVILAFDGDLAGTIATTKAGHKLANANINVSVIPLNETDDLDTTLLSKNFTDLLTTKLSFVDFRINKLMTAVDLTNMENVTMIVNEIESLTKHLSPTIQKLYMTKVTTKIADASPAVAVNQPTDASYNPDYTIEDGPSESKISNNVSLRSTADKHHPKQQSQSENRSLNQIIAAERLILQFCFIDLKSFQFVANELKKEALEMNQENNLLFVKIDDYYKQNTIFNIIAFQDFLRDRTLCDYTDYILASDVKVNQKIVVDCFQKLIDIKAKKQTKNIEEYQNYLRNKHRLKG